MECVDELLIADRSCAEQSVLVFNGLCVEVSQACDLALAVHDRANVVVVAAAHTQEGIDALMAIGSDLGIEPLELIERAKGEPTPGEDPRIIAARDAWAPVWAGQAQQALLQLCIRHLRWGVTDLRRLRLTAATGYLRLQAECASLLLLFRERNDFAARWLDPKADGKQFFRETQPLVKERLKGLNLDQVYEVGSAAAQHARFVSAVRAMRSGSMQVEVLDQEFDASDPFSFHLGLATFLRTQQRILRCLPDALPELAADQDFLDLRELFGGLVDRIWWVLERKYADQIKALYS